MRPLIKTSSVNTLNLIRHVKTICLSTSRFTLILRRTGNSGILIVQEKKKNSTRITSSSVRFGEGRTNGARCELTDSSMPEWAKSSWAEVEVIAFVF